MNIKTKPAANGSDATYHRLLADIERGLAATPKQIPPKWFYDEEGSALFEKITRLNEYYPTEAERNLLLANAGEIVELTGADTLVELGAGISDKTTALLDALAKSSSGTVRFVPFDISSDAIQAGVPPLLVRYPNIDIVEVVGDLDLDLDRLPTVGRRLIALLGGTIGNYEPVDRRGLLADIAHTMKVGDHVLLGTDLVKDEARLVAAYDDDSGVTAAFNKNVINVVSRTLGLDVSPSSFSHRAVWNADQEWIEMHLVAEEAVQFDLPSRSVNLLPGEHIRTEISAKFTTERLHQDLSAAGLSLIRCWSDGDYLISLSGLSEDSAE